MWKHYLWSFYLLCNPRLITGVGFNTPKWEGRLDNFVDGVRKKDKLIIAGLRVKQSRPINLAQLFPHYSPIGRSRIPHEAGRSQIGICVQRGWGQNYRIMIGGTERSNYVGDVVIF